VRDFSEQSLHSCRVWGSKTLRAIAVSWDPPCINPRSQQQPCQDIRGIGGPLPRSVAMQGNEDLTIGKLRR
jgi:hypothetical protein